MQEGWGKLSYKALFLDKETFLIDEIVNLAVIFYLHWPALFFDERQTLETFSKYTSLQTELLSDIDSVAAFLFSFSSMACY